jgi:plasmid maintenance system antidote protein VapI
VFRRPAFTRSSRSADPVTADTAARLAKYFGGDAASWLVMQANYDLKTLPTMDDIRRQVAARVQLAA